MNILIKRTGALGDVFCITPILKRIRQDYGLSARIGIVTSHMPVFEANPDLGEPLRGAVKADVMLDLDLAYERRPKSHVVDAFFSAYANLIDWDSTITVADEDKSIIFKAYATVGPGWAHSQGVVIHAARSWASRTFAPSFWDAVAAGLTKRGLKPIFVGAGNDYRGPLGAVNAVGSLSLPQVAALIANTKLFVGSDSALLHLAGATNTPIVGLYTSVRAKYRMPYRHGVLGWNMVGIEPELACRGCLERMPVPSTNIVCETGNDICARSISPDRVLGAVERLLASPP